MKKALSLLLVLSLMAALMAGCGTTSKTTNSDSTTKMGIGIITSIAKSKDYSVTNGTETLAMGQVDTVMAAATFDKDGKVVSVSIDNAQVRVNFDKDMKVTSDKTVKPKTKKELENNYNMKAVSGIKKEWFEQIAELEKWMVGKTVAEIKAMKVKAVDAAHPSVPDIPELTSLVTITIQDYVAALEKAYQNAVNVKGAVKLGLGHTVSISKSRDLGKDANGNQVLPMAQVDTVIAATAFDKDNKVVGTLIDNAQIRINFDANGKVTSDKAAKPKTKKELQNDYNMKAVSVIKKEWFEQMAELEKWMVGKTVADIKAMKVKAVDAAHPSVPDIAELTSLVTITIQDYVFAVEEALTNAR